MVYEVNGLVPQIADDVFVAPDAYVIGDVAIGAGSSVWFGCTIRGDVNHIRIGENCNIQDHSVLHVTGGGFPTILGDNVSLGHRVLLHACELKNNAFVGMGAVVMDGAVIHEYGFLAAGALLPPGKEVPAGAMAVGSPARVIRDIRPEEREMIDRTARRYKELKEWYRAGPGFRRLDG